MDIFKHYESPQSQADAFRLAAVREQEEKEQKLKEIRTKLTENFDGIGKLVFDPYVPADRRTPENVEKFNLLSFFAVMRYREDLNFVEKHNFTTDITRALEANGLSTANPYDVGKLLAERSNLLNEERALKVE